MGSAAEHLYVPEGYFYIFFGKMSIQILCPSYYFLNLFFIFLTILYILEIERGDEQRERNKQTVLTAEPDVGRNLTTLRS